MAPLSGLTLSPDRKCKMPVYRSYCLRNKPWGTVSRPAIGQKNTDRSLHLSDSLFMAASLSLLILTYIVDTARGCLGVKPRHGVCLDPSHCPDDPKT
jgi:hypothetical protein